MDYITEKYANEYTNPPFGGNGLGEFVYYRTYSRYNEKKGKREEWKDTCRRTVNYSMSFYSGYKDNKEEEAKDLFQHLFEMKTFTAGRTLWIGGTEAAKRNPLANFNCAFIVIDSMKSFEELFHLLLVGAGVGFRVLEKDISKLPEINDKIALANKPYHGKRKEERIEETMAFEEDGNYYIVVGDSKKGWTQALSHYLNAIQRQDLETILVNYDSVRPKGEMLKTFGGRSSGHEALRDMFKGIHRVLKHKGSFLTSIKCLDIANIIGYYVVVGGRV